MFWQSLAYFFGGVFLANGVPHFVHGISGKRFQSPFAKPPGMGTSSPLINVLWGMVNFVIGYLLLFRVGKFNIGTGSDVLMVALGAFVVSVALAILFGRVNGEL